MAELLDQPPEVLHHILLNVEPTDLASLSKTCRYLHRVIQADELLWKEIYLSRLDPPADAEDAPLSWRERMAKVVNMQKILLSEDAEIKAKGLEEVLTKSVELAYQAAASNSKTTDFLADLFQKSNNANDFLCKSSLFSLARPESWTVAPTEALCQLSAHLHPCLYMTLATIAASIPPHPVRHVHPYARARVYDLRRYTAANMWGPFLDDGSQRVDWEKVLAIMILLAYNHHIYTERRSSSGSSSILRPWENAFSGIAPNSFVSCPLSGTPTPTLRPDLDAIDPYGVTGTWMRIVCFLDYNDLFSFNFEGGRVPPDRDRDPITTREAFRLIRLQLRVNAIEEPGEEDGKNLPVVHFEGTSRSTFMAWDPNANSRIKGTVRQTPGGAIRWTTFSVFHGEERWRSEGVQVGGLRSARGIFGNWFDKDYDAHGPAGPTAFWKISDEMVEEKRPATQLVQIFMDD
ncbi:hypothetical protein A1O3_01239 [Capronia epimyces CBS 606.96]|uniref:F-box domain-containing protein n=1 Tax=Capronia epimyces CBS 606.96 TaxID=1182542 RepID=W9YIG9_9EURO|nr:uncharacterized protein A1O3_01239 [Capronia epimyces CBS 606.96]EXJ92687.1 hypothetical protein A1O3_01239 [Capronia epimyces CBS 606.96]